MLNEDSNVSITPPRMALLTVTVLLVVLSEDSCVHMTPPPVAACTVVSKSAISNSE